jgi:hypothetical protein
MAAFPQFFRPAPAEVTKATAGLWLINLLRGLAAPYGSRLDAASEARCASLRRRAKFGRGTKFEGNLSAVVEGYGEWSPYGVKRVIFAAGIAFGFRKILESPYKI